jgi:putative nucleotidyltransferase with HDIG domain
MKKNHSSPLIGQMTIFLILFIAVSIVILLLVGKALEIDIGDFWGNRVKLPLATLILGSASIILFAHFGAKFLTKPILILDQWTRGERQSIPEEVFNRSDELGHLARSMQEMRTVLENERNLIQIDRDTHRSLNEMRVITLAHEPSLATIKKLLSVLIRHANADAAMLVRRDPDGGGFSVVSYQMADGNDKMINVGGIILDDLVPERLLIRFLDAFEIPFDDLDEQAISWVNSHFGSSSESSRTFINMPVENEGQYIGSLVLVRSKRGPSLENLMPLAGGVISSAKYIEATIERDDNWISIMTSLSKAVDAKSSWTNGHSERVAGLANAIGKKLLMEDSELANLQVSALLHDVGKIAIPESIIDKPSRLSEDEMNIMKQHPERGAMIVENVPGYKSIRLAILHHHERWDGNGYPHGISGEEIPLHARIIAITDVFDAMTSDRPYRKGLMIEQALSQIESQSWAALDGELVKIFLTVARR